MQLPYGFCTRHLDACLFTAVFSQLNIFTPDCLRHPIQMAGVETIWELHTLSVIYSCYVNTMPLYCCVFTAKHFTADCLSRWKPYRSCRTVTSGMLHHPGVTTHAAIYPAGSATMATQFHTQNVSYVAMQRNSSHV